MTENQNIEYKESWRDEYPEKALREAVLNALIHRDYGFLGSDITIHVYDNRLTLRKRWEKRWEKN